MADKIRLEGVFPYDGEYEMDLSYFTMRELHTIKKVAGVRAGELGEALEAGDSDVVVAIALIALQRAGKQVSEDIIWDAPAGKVTLVAGEEEEADEDDPPTPQAVEPNGSSGVSSRPGSASPVSDQSPTGQQRSDTSAISAQELSAI